MRGPQTKTTSLKVDQKAPPWSTKMVKKFQTKVLGSVKTSRGSLRSNACPICMVARHHAKTCRDVLSAENGERSLTYCRKLRDTGKLVDFILSVTRRHSGASRRSTTIQMTSCGLLTEDESTTVLQSLESAPGRRMPKWLMFSFLGQLRGQQSGGDFARISCKNISSWC